jgi:hypothetical protein
MNSKTSRNVPQDTRKRYKKNNRKQSIRKLQRQWEETTKEAAIKNFFQAWKEDCQ